MSQQISSVKASFIAAFCSMRDDSCHYKGLLPRNPKRFVLPGSVLICVLAGSSSR